MTQTENFHLQQDSFSGITPEDYCSPVAADLQCIIAIAGELSHPIVLMKERKKQEGHKCLIENYHLYPHLFSEGFLVLSLPTYEGSQCLCI